MKILNRKIPDQIRKKSKDSACIYIKRMDNDFHIPDFLHTFFDIENGKTL